MTAPKQPLDILCFGDSLTEGYSQYGLLFTPYSATLSQKLQESLGSKYEIEVHTDGESGEQVTAGFLGRMQQHYGQEVTGDEAEPYDWVVFLGGTNDLGYGKAAAQIHAAITQITDVALARGAKVLLLTVPECAAKIKSLDERRGELNQLIREDARDGVYVLDLFEKMPYHSLSAAEREEVWDDGLHFTPKGYERIGNAVAERLIEILGVGAGGKVEAK